MKPHAYTIKALVSNRPPQIIEGKGRKNKKACIRAVMQDMDAKGQIGEVWVTESEAKAWAVWSYAAGSKEAHKVRSVPK